MTDQSYGTSGGIAVTDAVAERLADEAEQGFDLQLLERHRVGRPRLGKERTVVFQVRLEPAMRDALKRQAKASGTTPSELARRAIQVFLSSAPSSVGAGKAGRDQRRTARVLRPANVGGAMSAGAGSRSKPAIEVEPRSGGQWARQKQGTSRAASVHSTKAAAEAAARAQAKRERTELVVKGKDGRVQRRNSYGDDPRRSRR